MTTTDTPQRGSRSSNVIYTDSYRRLPTPRLKKGKHVVFVNLGSKEQDRCIRNTFRIYIDHSQIINLLIPHRSHKSH